MGIQVSTYHSITVNISASFNPRLQRSSARGKLVRSIRPVRNLS